MKAIWASLVLLVSCLAMAQKPASADNGNLESVLTEMDKSAANFKSAEADLQAEQYQKVVDETDTQKGKIYFRRRHSEMDVAIHIASPAVKDVVLTNGKGRIYEPKIDQVTERDLGKEKSDFEAFLSLGFGGRGHDLAKDYQVKLDGWETVDGVKTAKLELAPNSQKIRNMYNRIVLWVDPARNVLLKQQFFEPSGDYRLAHYANIKVNEKLSDDVFKLNTGPHTKVVKAQ